MIVTIQILNTFFTSKHLILFSNKYVNNGSDMAVFGVSAENSNDEITHFQMGRYVSNNEAMWHIFFISNTWKTPYCSSLGHTFRKWSKGVLYNGKRITS